MDGSHHNAVHVALLGDSIFDNSAYTNGQADVVTHLSGLLSPDGTATLLAADGSTTTDVVRNQIGNLAADVTHAAVSMGGNDAILHADLMDLPVDSTREALTMFSDRVAEFETNYRRALNAISDRVPQTAVCTIYNVNLPGYEEDRALGRRSARSGRPTHACQPDIRLLVRQARAYPSRRLMTFTG